MVKRWAARGTSFTLIPKGRLNKKFRPLTRCYHCNGINPSAIFAISVIYRAGWSLCARKLSVTEVSSLTSQKGPIFDLTVLVYTAILVD